MQKTDFLYEGKAKRIYATDDPSLVIMEYKDDATAFNNQKKGSISNKGILNTKISQILFNHLERGGIKTHLKEVLSENEQLCDKVSIIPLEVIVRNRAAGSLSKRLGIKEGTCFDFALCEFSYKDDALGDPLINNDHAVALGAATYEEIDYIFAQARQINTLLQQVLLDSDLILVDFKIEFGKNSQGEIILADEISPDTCRLWDKQTLKKLDKDRFRQELGDVEGAYQEVLRRLQS